MSPQAYQCLSVEPFSFSEGELKVNLQTQGRAIANILYVLLTDQEDYWDHYEGSRLIDGLTYRVGILLFVSVGLYHNRRQLINPGLHLPFPCVNF